MVARHLVIIPGLLTAAAPCAGQTIRLVPQFGHGDEVTGVGVVADGRVLVTASRDHTAAVWDVASGVQIGGFYKHNGELVGLSVGANGSILTGATDGSAYYWHVDHDETRLVQEPGWAITGRDYDYGQGVLPVRRVATDAQGRLHAIAYLDGIHVRDQVTGRRKVWLPVIRSGPMAFSADGRWLLAAAPNSTELELWDMERERRVHRLKAHRAPVTAVAALPDGSFLSGGGDSVIYRWRSDASSPVQTYQVASEVVALAVSSVRASFAVAGSDSTVTIRSVSTGESLASFTSLRIPPASALTFAPDGESIFVAVGSAAFHWDHRSDRVLRVYAGQMEPALALAVTPDELLVGGATALWRWNFERGVVTGALRRHEGGVTAAATTGDGSRVLTGGLDGMLVLWDLAQSEALWSSELGAPVVATAMDPSGRMGASATVNGAVHTWALDQNLPTGLPLRLKNAAVPRSLAFDGAADRLAIATTRGIAVWDVASRQARPGWRRENVDLMEPARRVLFGPGEIGLLGASAWRDVRLWSASNGEELRQYWDHPGAVTGLAFDTTGRFFYSAGEDGVIRRWNVDREVVEESFPRSNIPIEDLAISTGGDFLFSRHDDGSVHVWRARTRELLATLFVLTLRSDSATVWAVVAPDGRFDTSDLDALRGLTWIAANQPLRPLPIEIFMRGYFEPRLLARLMSGETLPPLPDLAGLDRSQPHVAITQVTPLPGASDRVRVTVQVERAAQARANAQCADGILDLRLFRDGQIVSQDPDVPVERPGLDLETWRKEHCIATDTAGRATRVFTVQVPERSGSDSVTFSAYAFNADRVKSPTHRVAHVLPAAPSAERRAYIIAIGVSGNQDPRLRLSFARRDAEAILDTMGAALRRTGAFDSVIAVPLITGPPPGPFARYLTQRPIIPATKAHIAAVFRILAGEEAAEPERSDVLAVAPALRRATPQDIVLISVAAHGVTAPHASEFFILPYDMELGSGERLTAHDLERAIASAELSQWLRRVDAGSLALILSTCFSQAAVAQPGFKPGPLGDPGFGQLAYDKGMLILAAAQSDALDVDGRSLVVDALIDELASAQTDVALADLLRNVERRVPERFREQQVRGRISTDVPIQAPYLFDFRRRREDVVLRPR